MLNFVRYYLEESKRDTKPIIVQFNPWWFSGSGERVLLGFFRQLSAAMGKNYKGKDTARKLLKIGSFLLHYAPIPYSQIISRGAEVLTDEAFKTLDDIFELRDEVNKELRTSKRKVVVFIDDIDRLYPEEMKQLFMIIKAVADFPNTVYLLAFDRNVVANSIGNEKVSGEDYLQKIIQMPVDLSLIDDEFLSRVLRKRIEEILADTDQSLRDDVSLGYVLGCVVGGNGPIKTLRDIYRLLNRLYLTYPIAKGNVVASDFVAAEVLSVFYPKIYDAIKSRSEKFISLVGGTGGSQVEEDKEFYDKLLTDEKTQIVRELLAFLFPRVANAYDHPRVGGKASPIYEQSRICSEAFPSYFCLTSANWISNKEMRKVLSKKKAKEIRDILLEEYTSKLNFFLERLRRGFVQELAVEELWSLTECLLRFGDELIRKADCAYELNEATFKSLSELKDQEGYFEKVRDMFNVSESITTMVDMIAEAEQRIIQKNNTSRRMLAPIENPFSENQANELKQVILKRIKETKDTKIFETPNLAEVLRYWHKWDKTSFSSWCEEIIENPEKYNRTKISRLHTALNEIAKGTEGEEKKHFQNLCSTLKSRLHLYIESQEAQEEL